MPPPLNVPLLLPRLHKSGRITAFTPVKKKPDNWNVEIEPGLPTHVPRLLHLNIWPGAVTTPSPANPLGLPAELTQALAFLTRTKKIACISPLVKTRFQIWSKAVDVPGLTPGQNEQFRGSLDRAVLNAPVPAPSPAIADDLRGRLLLTLTGDDPSFVIGALARLRGVSVVEPVPAMYQGPGGPLLAPPPLLNFKVPSTPSTQNTTSDPLNRKKIQDEELADWDNLVVGPAIPQSSNIAILDSGAFADHPSFSGDAILTPDTNWFPRPLTDVYGHGTHIASQILGRKVDDDILSVIPSGILPSSNAFCFNIFQPQPNKNLHFEVDVSAFYTALYTARLWHPVKVINLSIWMKDRPGKVLMEELNDVEGSGIIIVCCAGNNQTSTPGVPLELDSAYRVLYPARLPRILSIGATNNESVRASFSRFSTWNRWGWDGNDYELDEAGRWPLVDLAAPGVAIWGAALGTGTGSVAGALAPHVTSQDSKYGAIRMSGTSMAAPYVTAAIAAIRSDPKWSSESNFAVRQLLRKSIDSSRIPQSSGFSITVETSEFYGTGALDYAVLLDLA